MKEQTEESIEKGEATEMKPTVDFDVNINGVDTTFKAGSEMSVDTDGKISADEASGDGNTGRGIVGWDINAPNDYTIDYADYWKTPEHTVIAGHNIQKSGDCFSVGEGDTVKRNSATTSEITEYENCGDVIKVESAKAIAVDNYVFSDLGKSILRLDNSDKLVDADVTSAANNNSFDLRAATVILDSGEQFEAEFFSDGSITVSTEDPATITASDDEEVIATLTGVIDPGRKITDDLNRSTSVQAVGRSTVEIDPILGIVAVHL